MTPEERFRVVLSSVLSAKGNETDRRQMKMETPGDSLDLDSLEEE